MRLVVLAGWLFVAATGCERLLGADFDQARPRVLGPCDTTLPFNAPERLPINDLLAEAWAPRLTGDQLSLYFTSLGDDFVATRAGLADDFANPIPLAAINTPAAEMAASVTADGLTLFLETSRAGDVKIFSTKRNSDNEEFPAPTPVTEINSSAPGVLDIQPYVTPDGGAVYFGSTRGGASDYALYRAQREPGSDRFAPPVALASLHSLTVDVWPVVSPDELTIYFASTRNLADSLGSYDVVMATRASKDEDFGTVKNVREVNTAAGEYPSWISPDGCTLYLTRGPPNAMYVATRGGPNTPQD